MYRDSFRTRTLVEAFEDNFIPEPNSGCWLWLGGLFKQRGGYGAFSYAPLNIVMKRAHRISWMLYRGWLDSNAHVLHTCDNPCCVNPDHLFLGNQVSNMADMGFKGRPAQGENHSQYKHGKYIGVKKNPNYPTEAVSR